MRLEMGLETRLQLQQKLILAPQIIQSIEILQLPVVNLAEYVEEQLIENEALEVESPEEPAEPAGPETAAKAKAAEEEGEAGEGSGDGVQLPEDVLEEWEELRPRRRPAAAEERDRKLEALANSPSRPKSLQDRLAEQLALADAPERILDLARILIYNLDDHGYLAPHRHVEPLLDAMDEGGSLRKPLADVVASVDGVAAVKVPEARHGVTPEQIAEAQEARERNVLEAQEVLSRIQRIRSAPGGAKLSKHDLLLRYPLVEVLEREGGDWTLEEAEEALRVVQSLEPKGVGGRTVEETLRLQLDPTDLCFREKELLVTRHLDDLKKNRLQKIAREMGIEIDDLQLVLHDLHDLDLAPGSRLSPETARAVHPDVVVEESDGDFTVELVNSYLPPLAVRRDFVALMNDRTASPELREHARKRVESARWLIDAIQQRQATLTRVAERIVDHQRAFLQRGVSALRPLKMQTVADALGIHVSTVSRAIADKWVQTPQGIFPLKFFFTGGTENASGEVESRHNVKNRVKAIIDSEDPANPLSDDEVAARLKEEGLDIARRTVTKYRKQLGIRASRQRRVWKSEPRAQ